MYFLQVIFQYYHHIGATDIISNYDRIISSTKNCAKIQFILGYASDGGLYFPDTIPKLSEEQINHWSQLDYIDLVKVNH